MGIKDFLFSEHKFHGSFHGVTVSLSVIFENNEARILGLTLLDVLNDHVL